jgi:hypothetical protein
MRILPVSGQSGWRIGGFQLSGTPDVGWEHVRIVQGSHIVVPRLFDHDRAYMFQNLDRRIVFAIPYEGAHSNPIGSRSMPGPVFTSNPPSSNWWRILN